MITIENGLSFENLRIYIPTFLFKILLILIIIDELIATMNDELTDGT